jgi:hypothetical protein
MLTPIFNAAAGAQGSPYLAILLFAAKAVGNYVINDTNFAGLGKFLPGWVTIVATTIANVTVSLSSDNGTTWFPSAANGVFVLYADAGGVTGVGQGVSTSQTVRINVATAATDIRIYPMGNF